MVVSDADGIDALVQTLSTFEADEELQESVTLALLRLSFGKETEMREKIVAARALPQLVRLLGVRATALADRLQYCAAGCLGCIARGDAASRAAVREAGSLRPLLQSLAFSKEVTVQQECATALANISFGEPAAAEGIRALGGVDKLLERLRYPNDEVMNEERRFALQDAACGALLNLCLAEEGEGERCIAELVKQDGKDVLSKFVRDTRNEPAARKAATLLGKCGVKGVGTRGTLIDKARNVITGILAWRIAQHLYWYTYPGGDGTFDMIFSLGWSGED